MIADAMTQEVTHMVLDMTAQLAPVIWGMVALLVVAAAALVTSH